MQQMFQSRGFLGGGARTYVQWMEHDFAEAGRAPTHNAHATVPCLCRTIKSLQCIGRLAFRLLLLGPADRQAYRAWIGRVCTTYASVARC